MRIAWVNPSFLHYRVPVYAALDQLTDGGLHVVHSAARTPEPVRRRLQKAIGSRAIALSGETRMSLGAREEQFANVGINIPYQSGLVRAIEACKPDVIVTEGFFQWTPASLWVKRKLSVPMVIAYERTQHTERYAPRLRTLYRRWVSRQAEAICCNGALSKAYCTNVLHVPVERIVTGAMAADSDGLAAQCEAMSEPALQLIRSRFGKNRPIFLYVGRLIRLKGLRELLAGWGRYTASGGEGSLVLVGEGPEREAIEELIDENRLPRVALVGRAEYDQIASYYAAADVLVMPTLEDNWSLVVPEAMACGKPVLCSQFNGCWPELVQPGVNGYVFDPHNANDIAEVMRRCIDPLRLTLMGRESRRIVADYSPANAAQAVRSACEIAMRMGVRA